MTCGDDNDFGVVTAYRAEAGELPDPSLDRAVLRAAQAARLRRQWLAPGITLAAILILVWMTVQRQEAPLVPPAPASAVMTPGLYDGRIAAELGDPRQTEQSRIGQMPGGIDGEVKHGS
jgi:hypothetical protein